MQHDFHFPKVEPLAAQESDIPGAQRTCRQESGELPVAVLQFTTFISKDPYSTFRFRTFEMQPRYSKSEILVYLPREWRLGKHCAAEDSYQRGPVAGSEQRLDSTAGFSCQRDLVLMGWRTGFYFFHF